MLSASLSANFTIVYKLFWNTHVNKVIESFFFIILIDIFRAFTKDYHKAT